MHAAHAESQLTCLACNCKAEDVKEENEMKPEPDGGGRRLIDLFSLLVVGAIFGNCDAVLGCFCCFVGLTFFRGTRSCELHS